MLHFRAFTRHIRHIINDQDGAFNDYIDAIKSYPANLESLFAILDSNLITKPEKKTLLSSIPFDAVMADLADLMRLFYTIHLTDDISILKSASKDFHRVLTGNDLSNTENLIPATTLHSSLKSSHSSAAFQSFMAERDDSVFAELDVDVLVAWVRFYATHLRWTECLEIIQRYDFFQNREFWVIRKFIYLLCF